MTVVQGSEMREVGRFAGSDDVERWISWFEMAVQIDKLQEEEADALAMKLDGPAYDTWTKLSRSVQSQAAAIKTALRKAYGKSRTVAWSDLMNSTFVPGEPIDVCAECIKKNNGIALAGENPMDNVGTLVLMSVLSDDVKNQVALHLNGELSLEQVVSTAKTMMTE